MATIPQPRTEPGTAAAAATGVPQTAVDSVPTARLVRGFGRIPVTDISPVVEGGAYPAKAVAGELIPVRATIFREGHDAVNASVVLT